MQRPVPLLAVVHGLDIGLVLKEAAVLDGPADAGQVLEHHPAGADVGVAHLGVAHLPLGQTHVQPGGGQPAAGVLGKNLVQVRLVGGGDGVAGLVLPQAKAVHDDQGSRCFTHNNLESKLLLHGDGRTRRRKVRFAPLPPGGESCALLPCSSSPNGPRFAGLPLGTRIAARCGRLTAPGWPRSRSPQNRGPSGRPRRSARRPHRAGPGARRRSWRSWSRRTGW